MAGPGLRTAAVPALVGALWRRSGVGTTSHCSCGGTARALGDARRRRRSQLGAATLRTAARCSMACRRARAARRGSRAESLRTIRRPDDQHSSAVDKMILK